MPERRIAVFSPEDIYYTQDLPIKLIEIAPINSHYADKLSHRDVLGAILNLGIVRNKIGDIFLKDNSGIWLLHGWYKWLHCWKFKENQTYNC